MSKHHQQTRPSFTLVELLISIALVAMLSATALFTLYGVQEHGKGARTKASVARINEFVMEKWESYLTRPVPVRIPPTVGPAIAATMRLYGIRELMRIQLPDRKSDVTDAASFLKQPGTALPLQSSQQLAFQRRADRMVKAAKGSSVSWLDDTNGWTLAHQGAECLYLILSSIRDGDGSALDYFVPAEIGDVDEDGMKEILDGWGRPIEFLRWAPGFATNPGVDLEWGKAGVDDDGNGAMDDEMEAGFPGTDDGSELQPRDPTSASAPDPFDPRTVDTRPNIFALVPLIYSAGQDGVYDIVSDFGSSGTVRYATTIPPNDPYFMEAATGMQMGRPVDVDDPNFSGPDGILQCWDNITNHLVEAK